MRVSAGPRVDFLRPDKVRSPRDVRRFGLGEHEAVDLVVKFVDGSTTVCRNVSAGQTILVAGPR